MLRNDYPDQDCSAARALEVIGERWTLLIIRDVLAGFRRFDEMQESLGVARNVLASRLERLVDRNILERRPYSEHPPRHEYFLTEKGLDLWPVLVAMIKWGDRHGEWPDGPTMLLAHKGCGGEMDDHRICTRCEARLTVREVEARPGPGVTERVAERIGHRARRRAG